LPRQSDGEIFWKVTEGKSPMPSFKRDLTPDQRWDVVNYLRLVISLTRPEYTMVRAMAMKTGLYQRDKD